MAITALKSAGRRVFLLAIIGITTIFFGYMWFGSLENFGKFLDGNPVVSSAPVLKLGRVVAGTERAVVFELKNFSFQDVTIIGGRASCACMVPQDLPLKLESGTTVTVRVLFRVPESKVGARVEHMLELYADNGQDPITLRFIALVTAG